MNLEQLGIVVAISIFGSGAAIVAAVTLAAFLPD
jgi:hypothetical protein